MRTVLSRDAVTTRRPVGAEGGAIQDSSVRAGTRSGGARWLPDPGGPVPGGHDEWRAVGTEGAASQPSSGDRERRVGGRRASQTRAVLSVAVTIRDPSGLKAALHRLGSWPREDGISLPGAVSKTPAVLGPAPLPPCPTRVTMRVSSGLKAAEVNRASGTRMTATSRAVSASQTRAVPLCAAVTMSAPSEHM